MATTNPAPTELQSQPTDEVSPELAIYIDVMTSSVGRASGSSPPAGAVMRRPIQQNALAALGLEKRAAERLYQSLTLPGKPQLGGRRYIAIQSLGGQIIASHGSEPTRRSVKRGEVTVGDCRFVLISYQDGDVEVYRVESDNYTETFVGYARDAIKCIIGELS